MTTTKTEATRPVKPEPSRCRVCDGTGMVLETHPRWGSWDCPEPYVEVPCYQCGGGR